MILLDCQQLRRDYGSLSLSIDEVHADPLMQFVQWFQEALAAGNTEPHAMVLATVDATGLPDTRVVLLKEVVSSGFVFYTHYHSPKAQQLNHNAAAALNFYWAETTRQVRVRGYAKLLDHTTSATYFATRSRESQLAVYAAQQSSILSNNDAFAEKLAEVALHFQDQTIPCPPFWGGYCIEPVSIEFFQGRNGRLHDRIQYTLCENHWNLAKLAP